MISRALTTVLLTGLVGGLLVTGIQMLRVVPLIIQAENYEQNEFVRHQITGESGVSMDSDFNRPTILAGEKSQTLKDRTKLFHQNFELNHIHESASWIPEDGLERTFYTFISNILIGIAFSLMLVAVYLLRGKSVDINSGLFWGAAGFVIFSLAPSLGMPPKLPGMTVAALEARQIWWVFTVTSTAVGIGFLTESKSILLKMVAVILIILPQIIGAPNPHLFESMIPAELSSQFVTASLLTSAFFWVVVGAFSGFLYKKLVQELTMVSSS